jgi:hypothetical protein
MLLKTWRFVTVMLAAFSLSMNMAHLLEFPQRMNFDRDLWVRVTVIEGVYRYFGSVGAVFEMGAILTAFVLVYLVRKRGSTFNLSLGGAICLALAFASWLMFVAPANAEFAKWLTTPVPPDWTRWRDQWEYTHAINTFIKIIGLSLLLLSVIVETEKTAAVPSFHE